MHDEVGIMTTLIDLGRAENYRKFGKFLPNDAKGIERTDKHFEVYLASRQNPYKFIV